MKNIQLQEEMKNLAKYARVASRVLSSVSDQQKNEALRVSAREIRANQAEILSANAQDVSAAKEKNLEASLVDRLALNPARIGAMAKGLEEIAAFPDPVGKKLAEWSRPNGLVISRISVPLGVIGIIYESRPNVTADAAALSIKSGNAVILRGGSESFASSSAIISCLQSGLRAADLPVESVQMVATTDREAVGIMLSMAGEIDVIIPRGGKTLCERVMRESRVPTLLHLDGNCHSYVHESADLSMAVDLVFNAKMRRTGICGATESLMIDRAVAPIFLPMIADKLSASGCVLRGDSEACALDSRLELASDSDWSEEYLSAILSIKLVGDFTQAVAWINAHGSHHTDAIIAEDKNAVQYFLSQVDSAIVMHNTSTQFADGGEFGLGAEIGIATGKLHARGPVGAEQLTIYKYVVRGDGQIRAV